MIGSVKNMVMNLPNLSCNTIFAPNDIIQVLEKLNGASTESKSKTLEYLSLSCAFDIETTSFYNAAGEKCALMYVWTLSLSGYIVQGRTWGTFLETLNAVHDYFNLSTRKRLIIGVHNLAFEFQFMRHWMNWVNVFSLEKYKPIYAVCDLGIEFRCTYLLSGYSLESLAKNLIQFKIRKLKGDLDYTLIRNSETPLSKEEEAYTINDVQIIVAYLYEESEKLGGLSKLPITKTGYARQYCRSLCFENEWYKYRIRKLTLTPEEYKQLDRAFQGGFTHANPFISGITVDNVTSYDFTSSYPYIMVSDMFPMSKGELVKNITISEAEKLFKVYWCVFDIEFFDLESQTIFESYLSSSRCRALEDEQINNGRVVRARYLITTITSDDWEIIKRVYQFSHVRLHNFRKYRLGYLPTEFVKGVLGLYSDKTRLKGVAGKEAEYLSAKEKVNSLYGMTVMKILREIIIYDNEWKEPVIPDITDAINGYNRDYNRFLFFAWGVRVTSAARRNLWTGILACGADYCYSDTDAIKVQNIEKHMDYIKRYNANVKRKLQAAMKYHKLPFELCEPETIKGEKKLLGEWTFDGNYKRFKTQGAKRYMVEYSNDKRNGKDAGKISLTVSGLNKEIAIPYLLEKYGKDKIFDAFCDGMEIPAGKTGKMIHSYIDVPREGNITDYTGRTAPYKEFSAVHLEPTGYNLKLSPDYIRFIKGIRGVYR